MTVISHVLRAYFDDALSKNGNGAMSLAAGYPEVTATMFGPASGP